MGHSSNTSRNIWFSTNKSTQKHKLFPVIGPSLLQLKSKTNTYNKFQKIQVITFKGRNAWITTFDQSYKIVNNSKVILYHSYVCLFRKSKHTKLCQYANLVLNQATRISAFCSITEEKIQGRTAEPVFVHQATTTELSSDCVPLRQLHWCRPLPVDYQVVHSTYIST